MSGRRTRKLLLPLRLLLQWWLLASAFVVQQLPRMFLSLLYHPVC